MQILAKIVNDPINSSGIFAAGLGLCFWRGLYWHCGIAIPQLALCGQHPKVWLPFVVKSLGRGGAFCFYEDGGSPCAYALGPEAGTLLPATSIERHALSPGYGVRENYSVHRTASGKLQTSVTIASHTGRITAHWEQLFAAAAPLSLADQVSSGPARQRGAQACRPLNHESLQPAQMHDAQPVLRANFMLHPIEMILHRLFGERKVIGDLLVGHAARHQRN
jgi:hypothetical protein